MHIILSDVASYIIIRAWQLDIDFCKSINDNVGRAVGHKKSTVQSKVVAAT